MYSSASQAGRGEKAKLGIPTLFWLCRLAGIDIIMLEIIHVSSIFDIPLRNYFGCGDFAVRMSESRVKVTVTSMEEG